MQNNTSIQMSCPDCGWPMFGRAVVREGVADATVTCPRCASATRIITAKLQDGDPKYNGKTNLAGDESNCVTYDDNYNRVPVQMPNVYGPPNTK